jgi:hypothetical protein
MHAQSFAMEPTDSPSAEKPGPGRASSSTSRENFPSTVPDILEAGDIERIISNHGQYLCRDRTYIIWGTRQQNSEELGVIGDCRFLLDRSPLRLLRAARVMEQEGWINHYLVRHTEISEGGSLSSPEWQNLQISILSNTFKEQTLPHLSTCSQAMRRPPMLKQEEDSPIVTSSQEILLSMLVYRLYKGNEQVEDFLFLSLGKGLKIDGAGFNDLMEKAKKILEEGKLCISLLDE